MSEEKSDGAFYIELSYEDLEQDIQEVCDHLNDALRKLEELSETEIGIPIELPEKD